MIVDLDAAQKRRLNRGKIELDVEDVKRKKKGGEEENVGPWDLQHNVCWVKMRMQRRIVRKKQQRSSICSPSRCAKVIPGPGQIAAWESATCRAADLLIIRSQGMKSKVISHARVEKLAYTGEASSLLLTIKYAAVLILTQLGTL